MYFLVSWQRERNYVKGAVLEYAPQDQQFLGLVQDINRKLGIRAVPVDDVRSLKYALPRLVVIRDGIQMIYGGPAEIETALRPVNDNRYLLKLGSIGAIVGLCAVIVGAACAFSAPNFVRLVALCPIVSAAYLNSPCISCSGLKFSRTTWIAPVVALIALFTTLVIYTKGFGSRRLAFSLAVVVAMALLAQPMLMYFEPKVCPACLLLTFSLTYLCVMLFESRFNFPDNALIFPKAFNHGILVLVVLVALKHGLSLSGNESFRPSTHVEANFLHKNIADFVPPKGRNLLIGKHTLLITQPTCTACNIAKNSLSTSHIRFDEVEVCSSKGRDYCFKNDGNVISTPLLLLTRDGVVVFERKGWPSGEFEERELIQTINEFQDRPGQEKKNE